MLYEVHVQWAPHISGLAISWKGVTLHLLKLPTCCHFLNCQEKQCFFHLFTHFKTVHTTLIDEIAHKEWFIQHHDPQTWSSSTVKGVIAILGATKSLFENPHSHISADSKCVLLLTIHPRFPNLSVNLDTSKVLGIDDLYLALGDFFSSQSYTS
ncbi:hypothetical protein J3R83DRAFT_7195 [Lanmaoa asiatica]|nr:hypothetical protein J3R83DRAFT_7195 [Lanmaoa asiatica]